MNPTPNTHCTIEELILWNSIEYVSASMLILNKITIENIEVFRTIPIIQITLRGRDINSHYRDGELTKLVSLMKKKKKSKSQIINMINNEIKRNKTIKTKSPLLLSSSFKDLKSNHNLNYVISTLLLLGKVQAESIKWSITTKSLEIKLRGRYK